MNRCGTGLARLRTDAARLGARCAVSGCARTDQLTAALDAGTHYVSGPLVGPVVRTVCAPYKLDPAAAANPAPAPQKGISS
ncbi:hypothetical protein L2D00_11520 [Hyphomonadaceae bacterium BL14]|nr:hypothetical protein L2D00_11520 [Hyphomonadaceae bacterium BL14]